MMQSYLFQHMPRERFYVDNTTQLSNYAVIRNHIRGKRILDRIELTFFWKPE
jgi:hypothetical protein